MLILEIWIDLYDKLIFYFGSEKQIMKAIIPPC